MADPAPTPIVEWPDYNQNPRGGDPFTQDLNAPYDKVSYPRGSSSRWLIESLGRSLLVVSVQLSMLANHSGTPSTMSAQLSF